MIRYASLVSVSCAAILSAVVVGSVPSEVSAQSVIESQISGAFEGWDGETVVKLMNGQVWMQTEYYYEYHYAYMPDVLVYQSGGGWKMKVDGVSKAVGVEQLR